jgi:hypothetical protein
VCKLGRREAITADEESYFERMPHIIGVPAVSKQGIQLASPSVQLRNGLESRL